MDFSGKIIGGTVAMETAIAKAETPIVDANQTAPSLDFSGLVAAIKTANKSLEQGVEKQELDSETLITKPGVDPEITQDETPLIPLEGFVVSAKPPETSVGTAESTSPETLREPALFAKTDPVITPAPATDLPAVKTPETIATSVLAAKSAHDLVPNTMAQLPHVDSTSKQPAAPLAGLSALPPDEKSPASTGDAKLLDLPVYKQDIPVKQVEQTPPVALQKVQTTVTQTTQVPVALSAPLEIGQMASPDLFLAQPELGRMGALHAVSSAAPAAQGDVASLNMAKTISQQILVQISKTADPRIEIRLDPPELGRVVVSMVTSDNGIYATITAERPEIIDLMRRNAEILAAAFEKAGFGQADLHFQSDQNQQFAKDDESQSDTGQNHTQTETVLETELTYLPGDRLDIRL